MKFVLLFFIISSSAQASFLNRLGVAVGEVVGIDSNGQFDYQQAQEFEKKGNIEDAVAKYIEAHIKGVTEASLKLGSLHFEKNGQIIQGQSFSQKEGLMFFRKAYEKNQNAQTGLELSRAYLKVTSEENAASNRVKAREVLEAVSAMGSNEADSLLLELLDYTSTKDLHKAREILEFKSKVDPEYRLKLYNVLKRIDEKAATVLEAELISEGRLQPKVEVAEESQSEKETSATRSKKDKSIKLAKDRPAKVEKQKGPSIFKRCAQAFKRKPKTPKKSTLRIKRD